MEQTGTFTPQQPYLRVNAQLVDRNAAQLHLALTAYCIASNTERFDRSNPVHISLYDALRHSVIFYS